MSHSPRPQETAPSAGTKAPKSRGADGRTMDRAWESQAKTAQVRLGAASGLTVSAQIPVDGAKDAADAPAKSE